MTTKRREERGDSGALARLYSREQFAACVAEPDSDIDLAAAALWLAAEEYPALDPHVYTGHLESLADRVRVARGGRRGALAADRRSLLRRRRAQRRGLWGAVAADPR